MWWYIFLVLPLSSLAIRVPVDIKEENATVEITPVENKDNTYYVSDGASLDSYLIPPDQHKPFEVLSDLVVTPATYLLPPSPERQINYYAPSDKSQQTDWYPIAQAPPPNTQINLLPPRQDEPIPIIITNNQTFDVNVRGKVYDGERMLIPILSRQLLPPIESALNEYKIQVPSKELELPLEEINHQFDAPPPEYQHPVPKLYYKFQPKKNSLRIKSAEPTLALHLTPPKPLLTKYKTPTKLYPKKVAKGFHPIPIPIAEFAGDLPDDVPRAKPVKPFSPLANVENEYLTPLDEKNIYLYEQAEEKRRLRAEKEQQLEQLAAAVDAYGGNAPAEPETSETIYRHPGRNVYPAPLREAPPRPPPEVHSNAPAPPAPGERTEFHMHGMKGPHSYQFGFDTGKGKNRQFRYEERDNDGRVKGHYGYMDKSGKLRVVNYDADPEHGFHAEEPKEAEGSEETPAP